MPYDSANVWVARDDDELLRDEVAEMKVAVRVVVDDLDSKGGLGRGVSLADVECLAKALRVEAKYREEDEDEG